MYEINWSVEGVLKCREREKTRRRRAAEGQPKKLSPQERAEAKARERREAKEAKQAEHMKRLAEYFEFRQYKEEILRRDKEKRRTEDGQLVQVKRADRV